jgi:hypothetical protein
MNADVLKSALQSPHNARSRLTNRPTIDAIPEQQGELCEVLEHSTQF